MGSPFSAAVIAATAEDIAMCEEKMENEEASFLGLGHAVLPGYGILHRI